MIDKEKFIDLSVKADKYAWTKVGRKYGEDGKLDPKWEDVKLQKFAELVVTECAKIAVQVSMKKVDIHPIVKWDDMSDSAKTINHSTCQVVARTIKDQFGVK